MEEKIVIKSNTSTIIKSKEIMLFIIGIILTILVSISFLLKYWYVLLFSFILTLPYVLYLMYLIKFKDDYIETELGVIRYYHKYIKSDGEHSRGYYIVNVYEFDKNSIFSNSLLFYHIKGNVKFIKMYEKSNKVITQTKAIYPLIPKVFDKIELEKIINRK